MNVGKIPEKESLEKQAELIIKNIPKDINTVFELGVGEGRITMPILERGNIMTYDGIDYTPERMQIMYDKTNDTYPQFHLSYGKFQDHIFHTKYDLVLASEVLMHIPPKEIEDVITKMIRMSNKYVISIDYYSTNPPRLARHVFNHDYDKLYSGFNVKRIDLPYEQSMFIVGGK